VVAQEAIAGPDKAQVALEPENLGAELVALEVEHKLTQDRFHHLDVFLPASGGGPIPREEEHAEQRAVEDQRGGQEGRRAEEALDAVRLVAEGAVIGDHEGLAPLQFAQQPVVFGKLQDFRKQAAPAAFVTGHGAPGDEAQGAAGQVKIAEAGSVGGDQLEDPVEQKRDHLVQVTMPRQRIPQLQQQARDLHLALLLEVHAGVLVGDGQLVGQ